VPAGQGDLQSRTAADQGKHVFHRSSLAGPCVRVKSLTESTFSPRSGKARMPRA
jgi:hypothetical protein